MADTLPAVIEIIFISFFGLVLGSFATAVTYREMAGEVWFSLSGKKSSRWSKCPKCGQRLKPADLIPVFSWLAAGGRCRYCHEPISRRYLYIEIASLLACLGLYASYDFTPQAFILMAMVPFLLALIVIDAQIMLLPNRLVAICCAIAVIFVMWGVYASGFDWRVLIDPLSGLIAYPAVFAISAWLMTRMLGKSALGRGDIKFLCAPGLIAGFQIMPIFLISSGIMGVLTALIFQKYKDSALFPFGPSLILSLYIIMVFKPVIFQ